MSLIKVNTIQNANGTTALTIAANGQLSSVNTAVANVTTLNAPSGVLATQNGMTGICKAWVFYKGIATVGIQGSFNVSSVTYVSTGVYTIIMTTALPNSNYAVTTGVSGSGSGGAICIVDDPTTSTYSTTEFTIRNRANAGAASTDEYVHCAVFSS